MAKAKTRPEKASRAQRVTLYVKCEHQELIRWAKAYTRADSLSEAVLSALGDLKALHKQRQLQALAQTQGIWEGDPEMAEALGDMETEWETWRKKLDGS